MENIATEYSLFNFYFPHLEKFHLKKRNNMAATPIFITPIFRKGREGLDSS